MQIIPKDSQDRQYMLLGLKIVGDFGATIAIPVVAFVLIAQWLEGKYGYGSWLTVVAFILAAALTTKMIVKKAKEYGKQYQKIDEINKQENKEQKD